MTGHRIDHGLVRLPSGRVREMTAREITAHAVEMEAFAFRYAQAYDETSADWPVWERHAVALIVAEGEL